MIVPVWLVTPSTVLKRGFPGRIFGGFPQNRVYSIRLRVNAGCNNLSCRIHGNVHHHTSFFPAHCKQAWANCPYLKNVRQGQMFRNRPFRSLLRWKNYLPYCLPFPCHRLMFPLFPVICEPLPKAPATFFSRGLFGSFTFTFRFRFSQAFRFRRFLGLGLLRLLHRLFRFHYFFRFLPFPSWAPPSSVSE